MRDDMKELNDKSLFHTTPFVDGKWIETGGSGSRDLFNPSSGELIGAIPT